VRVEVATYHHLSFVTSSVGGEMFAFFSLFGVCRGVLLQGSLPEMAISVRSVLYLDCRKLKPSVILQTKIAEILSVISEKKYNTIYNNGALHSFGQILGNVVIFSVEKLGFSFDRISCYLYCGFFVSFSPLSRQV